MLKQGPRCNFDMGWGRGGTVSDSILGGGTRHFFLLTLYNSCQKQTMVLILVQAIDLNSNKLLQV